jgi:DNA-binding transcriptional LysR family regulator
VLDLKDVFYFVQVVDRGGFTAASRSLHVPKSTLSHRIQQLESSLGVRLVSRTSRQLGMTNVGREFYRHAQLVLRSAEAAESTVRQRLSEPIGTVRITTTGALAQFALREILPAFMYRHSKVRIVEYATDTLVDIVADGFDLALRGHSGPLPDSTLVQRTIAHVPWFLFAGPSYLSRGKIPERPEDLIGHSAIALARDDPTTWRLTRSGREEPVTIAIEPRFVSNDMFALKQAARAGLGIVALPGYVCWPEVRTGELVPLLQDWIASDASISALMPHRQGVPPAVRAVIDFLAAELPKAVSYGVPGRGGLAQPTGSETSRDRTSIVP